MQSVPESPDLASRLTVGSYLRLGTVLSRRHRGAAKPLVYSLLGDLNLHRRVRTAHVLGILKGVDTSGRTILDAGCGEGSLSITLAGELKGARVVGVDIDNDSIVRCRSTAVHLLNQNLDFKRADLTNLPFVEEFDVAVCVDVLEHVPDDEAALRCLFQALKPEGRLIIHVPMNHLLQRRVLPMHKRHRVADHVRDEYLRDEIVWKVRGAGFRLDRVRTTFGPAGELAFELNTLLADLPGVGTMIAAATFPAALALGYLDIASPARDDGNSFLLIARKPGDDASAPG